MSRRLLANNISGRSFNVQKKGTPWRKPRKRGGSPKGVREPPILATKKIKKQITCAFFLREALARKTGRIIIIDAPVVPTHDAINVPTAKRTVFVIGFPLKVPLRTIPPAIVNKAQSIIIKGM